MKQQLNLLFHAFRFYSRIPVGELEYSEENQTKAFRYFPLVGIVVGIVGGAIYVLLLTVFSSSVAVIGSIASMVFATGALHEDGLSDFFDGFGGGNTKEKVLDIMKDSTVGVYGVLALIVLFLTKYSLFLSIDEHLLPKVMVAAHASSRFMPIVMINTSQYARVGNSKAMHTRNHIDRTTCIVALLFAAFPLVFLSWQTTICVVAIYFLLYSLLKRYVEKRIGGFTGDALGALQQFCEVGFYFVYAALSCQTYPC